jgi:two-component system, sensor histidine kinase and response regulator
VIAMTADALHSDRERCLAAGMDDFVVKPVRLEDLAAVLARWLPSVRIPIAAPTATPHRNGEPRPLFDREEALSRVQGQTAILSKVAAIFLRTSREYLGNVRDALARADAEALWKGAHALKGAAAYLSVHRVYDAASRLEKVGRNTALDEAPAALADLESTIAEVEPLLREFLEEA